MKKLTRLLSRKRAAISETEKENFLTSRNTAKAMNNGGKAGIITNALMHTRHKDKNSGFGTPMYSIKQNAQTSKPDKVMVSTVTPQNELVAEGNTINSEVKFHMVVAGNQDSMETLREVFVSDDELDRAIEAAFSMAQRGNLVSAGSVLGPLIPHITEMQRTRIINKIGPLFQQHFQKAYIIKTYEPTKARTMMNDIIKSGLFFIPCFPRAKLFMERN